MKKIFGLLALVGGMSLGEYIEPYTSMKNMVQFHQVPVAKDFPQDPWNYKVQRELIEEGEHIYQGLYLVNETQGIHKKIDAQGCTCGIDNSIDDMLYDAKKWVKEKTKAGKEWVEDTYKGVVEKDEN